jgi:hypothetical protein
LLLCGEFVEHFVDVYLLDRRVFVPLDCCFHEIDLIAHLVDPAFGDDVGFADLVVDFAQPLEVPACGAVVVVVLGGDKAVAVGFAAHFFYALELFAEAFVDLVVGVVDGFLADGVDLADAVFERGTTDGLDLEVAAFPTLFLLHSRLYKVTPFICAKSVSLTYNSNPKGMSQ